MFIFFSFFANARTESSNYVPCFELPALHYFYIGCKLLVIIIGIIIKAKRQELIAPKLKSDI